MAILPVVAVVAAADDTALMRLLNPLVLEPLIPIVAIVIIGSLVAAIRITKMVVQHRERMAKIQMGIDPDAGPTADKTLPGRN
jgi:hypothetical protein